MGLDYDYKRLLNRKDVYTKLSKQVLLGDVLYPSVAAAARSRKMTPSSITNAIKRGHLLDGTKVSFVKTKDEGAHESSELCGDK